MMKERNELATPALSGLLDFWLTKSAQGTPPVSSSIAPADLRPWKDNIVVFEVIGEDDFVYSYYGKALAEAFGHSRLGATLDELPAEQRAILYPEYATVRRERLPIARVYTADFSGVTRTWERLVLPMSSDGEEIDKLLVAAYEIAPSEIAPADIAPPDVAESSLAPAAEEAPDVSPAQPGNGETAETEPVDSEPADPARTDAPAERSAPAEDASAGPDEPDAAPPADGAPIGAEPAGAAPIGAEPLPGEPLPGEPPGDAPRGETPRTEDGLQDGKPTSTQQPDFPA
ncbi:hypothetical protein [Azospirillum sp. SYSU D00513]|uniref:hypothetical protein n=1 Tax=Azospirillum sp. SYSU D00513 TaxID=2812561 RepID=UPI0020000CAA|nr:hypothetical protein [Azospirillum sp. SYSU D00513]